MAFSSSWWKDSNLGNTEGPNSIPHSLHVLWDLQTEKLATGSPLRLSSKHSGPHSGQWKDIYEGQSLGAFLNILCHIKANLCILNDLTRTRRMRMNIEYCLGLTEWEPRSKFNLF